MFYHLQYIHLFRPLLRYTPASSPLPSHVSPRRICTANAGAISKLMRLYKKMFNLRQICNIAVYMIHSACTIHMLNLPEKTAKRDVIHGVKHLEEIAEDWLCARRTLCILSVLARKWNVDLPEEAAMVLQRTDEKYGTLGVSDVPSPYSQSVVSLSPSPPPAIPMAMANSPPTTKQEQYSPMNHYSHLTSPPSGPPEMPTSTMPSIMSSLAMAGGPSQRMQNHPSTSVPQQMSGSVATSRGSSSMSLNDQLSGMWSMGPTPTQAMPHYTPAYNNMQQRNNLPSTSSSRTGTRHVSPNSAYAIDGQDWYLKDAVNWHQNFEAWNLSSSVGHSSSNSINGTVANAPAGVGSNGGPNGAPNGGSAGNGDSMFMFRGNNDMESSSFHNFGSMNAIDTLPDLD
jgi:hypothetical protein